MRALPSRLPPSFEVSASWRELWRTGGFVQNDLISQSGFASIVKERLPQLGIRQDWLEEFDEAGAFKPIAFVAGGEPPGVTDLTPYEPNMAFREEQPHLPTAGRFASASPSSRAPSPNACSTTWAL